MKSVIQNKKTATKPNNAPPERRPFFLDLITDEDGKLEEREPYRELISAALSTVGLLVVSRDAVVSLSVHTATHETYGGGSFVVRKSVSVTVEKRREFPCGGTLVPVRVTWKHDEESPLHFVAFVTREGKFAEEATRQFAAVWQGVDASEVDYQNEEIPF